MRLFENIKVKWLRKVLIFVLGLLVIFVGCSNLFKPSYEVYDYINVYKSLNRVNSEKDNTVDVLFAGNSECADGFSPIQLYRDYGITSQNIGFPLERLCDSYAMINEIIKHQSPKLIVLESDSFFLDSKVYDEDDEYLEAMEKIFPILHYHQVYRLWKPDSIRLTSDIDEDKYKGFWVKNGNVPYTGDVDYVNNKVGEETSFNEDALVYLNKIVELCKENNITLCVMTMPSPNNFTIKRHNCIQAWCDNNGINYYDLNYYTNDMNIDWNSDSLDGGDHLNFDGTVKVNNYIGEILAKTYSLSDRRGDSNYDSWSKALALCEIYGGSKG